MHVSSTSDSPLNQRGGQTSYLLLAKGQFGSRHLAVTWVECPADSEQPRHEHPTQEQVYVIIRGRGTMTVGDQEQAVEAGMLIFVPPRTGHSIRTTGHGPLTYVSATAPPFDPQELGPAFTFEPR